VDLRDKRCCEGGRQWEGFDLILAWAPRLSEHWLRREPKVVWSAIRGGFTRSEAEASLGRCERDAQFRRLTSRSQQAGNDRKGRKLSWDDIQHYQKIVVAIKGSDSADEGD
jgi:hypothetical protein